MRRNLSRKISEILAMCHELPKKHSNKKRHILAQNASNHKRSGPVPELWVMKPNLAVSCLSAPTAGMLRNSGKNRFASDLLLAEGTFEDNVGLGNMPDYGNESMKPQESSKSSTEISFRTNEAVLQAKRSNCPLNASTYLYDTISKNTFMKLNDKEINIIWNNLFLLLNKILQYNLIPMDNVDFSAQLVLFEDMHTIYHKIDEKLNLSQDNSFIIWLSCEEIHVAASNDRSIGLIPIDLAPKDSILAGYITYYNNWLYINLYDLGGRIPHLMRLFSYIYYIIKLIDKSLDKVRLESVVNDHIRFLAGNISNLIASELHPEYRSSYDEELKNYAVTPDLFSLIKIHVGNEQLNAMKAIGQIKANTKALSQNHEIFGK